MFTDPQKQANGNSFGAGIYVSEYLEKVVRVSRSALLPETVITVRERGCSCTALLEK